MFFSPFRPQSLMIISPNNRSESAFVEICLVEHFLYLKPTSYRMFFVGRRLRRLLKTIPSNLECLGHQCIDTYKYIHVGHDVCQKMFYVWNRLNQVGTCSYYKYHSWYIIHLQIDSKALLYPQQTYHCRSHSRWDPIRSLSWQSPRCDILDPRVHPTCDCRMMESPESEICWRKRAQ